MKYFKLKHPVSFPITACWGITATKYAVIIYLGLRGFVIELPQRKLTQRVPDVCPECAGSGKTGSIGLPRECPYCDGTGTRR